MLCVLIDVMGERDDVSQSWNGEGCISAINFAGVPDGNYIMQIYNENMNLVHMSLGSISTSPGPMLDVGGTLVPIGDCDPNQTDALVVSEIERINMPTTARVQLTEYIHTVVDIPTPAMFIEFMKQVTLPTSVVTTNVLSKTEQAAIVKYVPAQPTTSYKGLRRFIGNLDGIY